MPELPEVETVCRGLAQKTAGLPIQRGKILLPRTLAYPPSVQEFERGIQGKEIASWQRRGKYLLAKLSSGWLGVHLRMSGQLLWLSQDAPLHRHARVRLFFAENRELRFVDTRTFGKFWFLSSDRAPETVITGLQKLGPEPFSPEFSVEYLEAKLAKSQRAIKTILLDQSLVAGIGNIYGDEALFISKIRPDVIASQLSASQIAALRTGIIEVLERAIAAGGTTFSDFLQVTGVNGNYGGMAWVYGRKGQPCRICSTPIEKSKLGGRSAHFCPNCQG